MNIVSVNTDKHKDHHGMPRYLSKSSTYAMKIAHVEQSPAHEVSDIQGGSWELIPENPQLSPITVSHDFYNTWRPYPGSYYVSRNGELPTIVSGTAFEYYHLPEQPLVPAGKDQPQVPDMRRMIPLDVRTRLQMAVLLLTSGTEEQKLDALAFLADVAKV